MLHLQLYTLGVALRNLIIIRTTLTKDSFQLGNICFQASKTYLNLKG